MYNARWPVLQRYLLICHVQPAPKGGDEAAVLETENDLLRFVFHRNLPSCVFTPVAARPQCSYVKNKNLAYVKRDLEYVKGTTWKMQLTIIRSNLQGSCAWRGKRSSLIWSWSLSVFLRFHACSRASSVLLCQNTPRNMSNGPCETSLLTISRRNLQGSCVWDGKRSSAIYSSSLFALLHVRACNRASSVPVYR